MNRVLHISTECYPAAKAGGMGDVVGALPLYLPQFDVEASVIIPKYKRKWFANQTFKSIHKGKIKLGSQNIDYSIQKLVGSTLDYPFYCIDIPGLFDREDIYLGEDGHGYKDEAERNIAFQIGVLNWLNDGQDSFDLLHCHDHMTGLIPFFIRYGKAYQKMAQMPTMFTIHNGQYRGIFDWSVDHLLPEYDTAYKGLLDWDGHINSLATAIKCSWKVNTVSPAYMEELIHDFDTLTPLVRHEREKCHGIINGIDNKLWDPAQDLYLDHHLVNNNWKKFKSQNKSTLIKQYNLKSRRPLIGFIGRLAHQKGADILESSIRNCLSQKLQFAAVVLGSGDKQLEYSLTALANDHPRDIEVIVAYDERLARIIYAGCDFLMMPSRFEPCGLNQMYAMRYGTIPIVPHVGGLKDTVPDISDEGNGIVANTLDADGFSEAIHRAVDLYKNKSAFEKQINKITGIDFSWNQSAQKYASLYLELMSINN